MKIHMTEFITIYRRNIFVLFVFLIYIYFMFDVLIYYKTLNPAYHSSLAKGRTYLIDTEGYRLPDFDPYHSSVLRYLQPSPEIKCDDGKRPLTSGLSNYKISNGTSSSLMSAIIIEEDHLVDYNVRNFSCCFQTIKGDASGDSNYQEHYKDPTMVLDYPDSKFYMETKCHLMNNKITTLNAMAAFVQCTSDSFMFYRTVHLFVPVKEHHTELAEEINERPNVLILGIDSVSRINMQRYMPKTFKYLNKIGAIDLKGFNKVYENTYPNVLAILTGLDFTSPEYKSYPNKTGGYFDNLPFMWKAFSSAGYETFFVEDCSSIGIFNYKINKGFRKPPTDYYFRPYVKALDEILGSNNGYVWIADCKICGASKLILEHILDYAADISKYFGKIKPSFSFLWTGSLTHDRLHFAGDGDEPVLKFLKNMIENDYWKNTIVFFMSDHGVRYGGIRETYIGRKEESLPFNYMIVPKRFKEKYSLAYKNLMYNQDRLTTTMDLHETLVDIAKEEYKNEDYLRLKHNVSEYRVSLFRKISSFRSCFNAKIPLIYCAGQVSVEVSATPLVNFAGKEIMSTINKGLTKFPMCHQLYNFTVRKSYILQFFEIELYSNITFYEVQIISYPGEALLEGIVQVHHTENYHNSKVIGDISRINEYGNQSHCIGDTIYVKYCLCKDR